MSTLEGDEKLERYQVGDLVIDIGCQQVTRNGEIISLPNLSFDLLKLLVRKAPQVVTHDQIMNEVWPDVMVNPETLTKRANLLRSSLNDGSDESVYIEPVRGRGYRVIKKVVKLEKDKLNVESIARNTSRNIKLALIGLMSLTSILFAIENYVVDMGFSTIINDIKQKLSPPEKLTKVAVLPLRNYSNDPEQEYFSDGLTEEIIAQLGGQENSQLGVIARTSAMYYKGKNKKIDEIGKELDVDFILEGSVRRSADRIRITAQLIKVSDQTKLWSQSFERSLADIFNLQSEIAQRVSRTLVTEVLPVESSNLKEFRPINSKAYEEFLKGRYYESIGDRNAYIKASEHYQLAVQYEPTYALAHAALAHNYGMLEIVNALPIDEAERKFWFHNRQASELNPNLAEVEINFADFKFYRDWNWAEGEAGFRRALKLNPRSESAVWHYAMCLNVLGRAEEVVDLLEAALQFDPHSDRLNSQLFNAFFNSKQYEKAAKQVLSMIERKPDGAGLYVTLGDVYIKMAKQKEAFNAYIKSRQLSGDSASEIQKLSSAYNDGGIPAFWSYRVKQELANGKKASSFRIINLYIRAQDTENALASIEKARQINSLKPYHLARMFGQLGENDRAIASLEEAYSDREMLLPFIKFSAQWDPLRDDPRFQEILQRMNLPN